MLRGLEVKGGICSNEHNIKPETTGRPSGTMHTGFFRA
jgi:hypothetical protein